MSRALFLSAVGLLLALGLWELLPEGRTMIHQPSAEEVGGEGQARPVGQLPRLYLVYHTPDGKLYGIEDHFLFVSEDGGATFERRGKLPKVQHDLVTTMKDLVARSKLVRRLRKNQGPTNLVVLSTGTVLIFWDQIYRSTDGGRHFESVFDFGEGGFYNPFDYSEGVTVGRGDTIYLGEYLTTPRPHPVRVLRGVNDGTEWNVAHQFPSGDIFHIHSIQYDPFRDVYWVATGDNDEEASLWYTGDSFESLSRLGGGSQDWRIVSLMITPEYLYWGSDNDRSSAGIFRWDFQADSLEKLRDLGKVSYYSTILQDGTLVLSTTYEPESQFTRENDPGESTELWVSDNGSDWRMILSLPYERTELPWGLSRARIAFPGGAPLQELFFTPVSTSVEENTTFLLKPPF